MKIVILGRTKIVELGGERKNPNIIQIVISKIIENYFHFGKKQDITSQIIITMFVDVGNVVGSTLSI